MQFKKVSDSAHGWLRVSVSLYLSHAFRASDCSYYDSKNRCVWLEEDADAPKFLEQLQSKGVAFGVESEHVESAHVRDLPSIAVLHQHFK